jgi:hypothetical protein
MQCKLAQSPSEAFLSVNKVAMNCLSSFQIVNQSAFFKKNSSYIFKLSSTMVFKVGLQVVFKFLKDVLFMNILVNLFILNLFIV